METAKTLGLIIAIILIVAFVAWEQRPQDTLVANPTPSPTPTLQTVTTPAPLAPGWQWIEAVPYGFRIAYPTTLFSHQDTMPIETILGAQRITLLTRLLGSRGYLSIGVLETPYTETSIIDNESVRAVTPLSIPFSSGVRYITGNMQCATMAYRFPLSTGTLRISWSGCFDQYGRFDGDTVLHEQILQTLQRIP